MKRLLLAAALLMAPLPAWAMLAPQYYQQARDEAPDVIVVHVVAVVYPEAPIGECKLATKVIAVERGQTYWVEQGVVMRVHCRRGNAEIPAGGTIWTDMARLKPGIDARVFMKDGKPALDAFDIL
ncbi:MAG: hypothetical protein U1E50_17200 [Caulobacteraceae bacterium]